MGTPAMPSRTAYFKCFATEHSWYKHIPLPVEFGIRIITDPSTGELRWASYYLERMLDDDVAPITDPILREAIRANTWRPNALVYSDDHGFNHTVAIGGNKWFAWLKTLYPEDAKWVRRHSQRSEHPHRRGEWFFSTYDLPRSERDAVDEQIKALKAKEYARLLDEFKTKAAYVWDAYVKTLK